MHCCILNGRFSCWWRHWLEYSYARAYKRKWSTMASIGYSKVSNVSARLHAVFSCLAPSTKKGYQGGRIRGFSYIGTERGFNPRDSESVDKFEEATGLTSRAGRKGFLDELAKASLVEKQENGTFILTDEGQTLQRGLLALVDTYAGTTLPSEKGGTYYPFVDVGIYTDGREHTEWIWNVSMSHIVGKLEEISWWAQSETMSMPPGLFQLKSFSPNIKAYEMELDDPLMKRFKLKFAKPQVERTHFWYSFDWPHMFTVGNGPSEVKFHFLDFPIGLFKVSIYLPPDYAASSKSIEPSISRIQRESKGLGDFVVYDPIVLKLREEYSLGS
jgi:hypothetical protein